MKKLFYFLLTLSLCLGVLSLSSLAAAPQDSASTSEAEAAESAKNDTAPEGANDASGKADHGASFIESIYQAYEQNKSELFSLASALVSLVLVFVYQKGLLPTVKGGLTLIEGQVKAMREVSSDTKEQNAKAADDTRELALKMSKSAEGMQRALEEILARTESEDAKQQSLAQLRQCLLWQSELLGEVFLHSSLPEYDKERVGAVVERVKATLTPKESEA